MIDTDKLLEICTRKHDDMTSATQRKLPCHGIKVACTADVEKKKERKKGRKKGRKKERKKERDKERTKERKKERKNKNEERKK